MNKKVIFKERKTETKRVIEVPVKCCSDIVIHKHFVSLRFRSKSELLSPPVAPVGSLHASRHQATVMEKEVGWVVRVGEKEQRRK